VDCIDLLQNERYSDRYDNASAAWVVICAILMFFMKAGFLYVEQSFSRSEPVFRRRVVLAKYIDIFAGTISFWLFGYAISGNTTGGTLGEEQDFIFWFFRFTFASNTATIIGGTLVGSKVQLRVFSVFIYSFLMTVSDKLISKLYNMHNKLCKITVCVFVWYI
jgi:Amt family ammonium transporter